MINHEDVQELRHEFSLKLAQQLDQKKLGVQEAGSVISEFSALLGEKGDCDEVRQFIDQM